MARDTAETRVNAMKNTQFSIVTARRFGVAPGQCARSPAAVIAGRSQNCDTRHSPHMTGVLTQSHRCVHVSVRNFDRLETALTLGE
jgi:hypothetical protein